MGETPPVTYLGDPIRKRSKLSYILKMKILRYPVVYISKN